MKLYIDPHLKSPTEVYLNGELFTTINGNLDDQILVIKEIIKYNNILDWGIDKKGIGIYMYDEINNWFQEHRMDIIEKRRKQEIIEGINLRKDHRI